MGTATEFFELTQLDSTLPGRRHRQYERQHGAEHHTLTTTILDPAGSLDSAREIRGHAHARRLSGLRRADKRIRRDVHRAQGVARPLREPGIEISLPVPPDPTSGAPRLLYPALGREPRADHDRQRRPRRLVVDLGNLARDFLERHRAARLHVRRLQGAARDAARDEANISAVPVPTPSAGEFTIAGFNIENFNNNATQRQKAALAIRDVLRLPDIIGTIEIFDLADLQALAAEIQTISGVTYEARLIEADGDERGCRPGCWLPG